MIRDSVYVDLVAVEAMQMECLQTTEGCKKDEKTHGELLGGLYGVIGDG